MMINQRNLVRLLIMIFLMSVCFASFLFAADYSEFVVKNLKVEDVPDDDGSGLKLSWTPLSKEARIIEYRVYRGVTEDSLFYIGKIDVNVKTGVAGDVMYYYDTGYNYFLSINSRGKLKREKNQPQNIFREIPRDINISGPLLKEYRILSVVSNKNFFDHNVEVQKKDKDGNIDIYAGFKLRNLTQLAKKLKKDKKYYYSVIAVNEKRRYYPHAPPAIGIARENDPEEIKELYAVAVKDAVNPRIQFEFSLAGVTAGHRYHSIYMIEKDSLEAFNEYRRQLDKKELYDIAVKVNEHTPEFKVTAKNPAKLIFSRHSCFPYTPNRTAVVKIVDGKTVCEEDTGIYEKDTDGAFFDINNLENYYFSFSIIDGARYATYSDPVQISDVTTESELPVIPAFTVSDRESDKGDYNKIMWGKPIINLTNSYFLNEKKTKLSVNYEILTNDNFKIKNVYFDVYDENGKQIGKTINEYYQDLRIKVKLPKGSDPKAPLKFVMRFKCNNELPENYELTQILSFDPVSRSLAPGELKLGNEDVFKYQYSLYRNTVGFPVWRLAKKTVGSTRQLYDSIRNGGNQYFGVSEYDAEKGLFLMDSSFGVGKDYTGNLYKSAEFKRERDYIISQQTILDTLKDEAKIKEIDDQIAEIQKSIDDAQKNPIGMFASKLDGKKRIDFLHKLTEVASRSFHYMIIKSDGKGHFSQTKVFINDGTPIGNTNEYFPLVGKEYFMPVSNWFKKSMFPAMIAALFFGLLVFIMISKAKKGHDLYVRPIAGIQEIDNAIGRATEMGRPILFVPGLSSIGDVATLAGLAILGKVAKKAAEYDTKILVPCRDYLVLPIAQEIVKEAHYEAGRPDSYDKSSVFFITTTQFAFVAGVNGIMIREKTATNFYMGMFWAESLLMTETGNITGAIQISGTDAVTQIPFFITTCDYTLIGEELYAASAYMAREPLQLGTLKAVDYLKLVILIFIVSGTLLSSAHLTFLIDAFPEK